MKNNKILKIFLIVSLGLSSIFIFLAILMPNLNLLKWLVMEHNFNWQFSDYFRQIVYASDLKHVYITTADAPFPPFAYLLFHLLWRINPFNFEISLSSWNLCMNYKNNLLIFFIILIILCILFGYIIKKTLSKNSNYKNNLIIIALLLSAPFLAGAIERGNCAFLVLILLLFALYFKESNNKILKECALICIAIAAALKIYPAVFGLLYLKDKRYKETFRLVIYGLCFFFIPFAFTGGIDGVFQYLDVLGYANNANSARFTSISCFISAFLNGHNIDYMPYINYIKLISYIYMAIAIVCAYFEKEKWKSLLFLTSIMSVCIPNSYRYVAIYMTIPLIYFIKDKIENHVNIIDYIYVVLFSLIFSIPIFGFMIEVDLLIFTFIYLLIIVSLCDFVKSNIVKKITNKFKVNNE